MSLPPAVLAAAAAAWLAGAPVTAAPTALPSAEPPRTLDEVRALDEAGRQAEAEQLARRILTETEGQHGAMSQEAADVLEALVHRLLWQGKVAVPETRQLAERVLAIRRATLGVRHPSVATALHDVGVILGDIGERKAAREALEESLAIDLGDADPDGTARAATLQVLGQLELADDDLAAARERFEEALAVQMRVRGPDHLRVAGVLNDLAGLDWNEGNLVAAQARMEEALAVFRRVLGAEHEHVAAVLQNIARVRRDAGDLAGARERFEEALAILRKAATPRARSVAACLHGLGQVQQQRGDLVGARRYLDEALALLRKERGDEHPDVLTCMHDLASVLRESGETAAARVMLEDVVGTSRRVLGADHAETVATISELAILLQDTGDLSGARALLEPCVSSLTGSRGPESPHVAIALSNLANVHHRAGDLAAARRLWEQALTIQRKAFGAGHLRVANALHNLGVVLTASGDVEAARAALEQALPVLVASLGPRHPRVARCQTALALAWRDAGRVDVARTLLEGAVDILRDALGARDRDVAVSLHDLGTVLALSGEPEAALEAGIEAEAASREAVIRASAALSEREMLAAVARRPHGACVALSVAPVLGAEDRRRAWSAFASTRALALDEVAARHRDLAASVDAETSRLAAEVAATRRRLATLVVRKQAQVEPQRHRELVDAARVEAERAERALVQRSAAFRRETARREATLDDALELLPADSALVAYAVYRRHPARTPAAEAGVPGVGADPAGACLEQGPPVHSVLAFAIRAGEREPACVRIGSVEDVEALVAAWRREAGRRATRQGEEAHREAGRALARTAWEPVADRVAGASSVFIVPDGALSLVSFAALPAEDGSYLLETGPALHYLSTERDLVALQVEPERGLGLLAFGDPAFDDGATFASLSSGPQESRASLVTVLSVLLPFRGSQAQCATFREMRFARVPRSGLEASDVATLWRRKGGGTDRGALAQHLSGPAATEAAFKARAPGKRVLHLATHGFFVERECESAAARGEDEGGASRSGTAPGENPLVLSGLALAGANHREAAGPEEEDGVLTAEEIAALDLSGVEWAVLSACNTGVGEVQAGEGVLGLRRAFQVAGAGTLITSLWPVDDEATRRFMRSLYEARLVSGLDTAAAMRHASLEVLRQERAADRGGHPSRWAAFVAAGEWR